MRRFRWPLGKLVTLNAERSVICDGVVHRVRLSQEGVGSAVITVVAVAVTTTVTIEVRDGTASTVLVSKAVATSVTRIVVAGSDVNGIEE